MSESGKDTSCDLFVIGAGSGGVRAARVAASLGANVIVAENLYLGGTCVNVGCVPKKLYVYGSEFGKAFGDAAGFGWTVHDSSFDWATLRDNKTREINRLNSIYNRLLETSGARVIEGTAILVDSNTVEVNGTHYQAKKILLATGSWPSVPDFPGNELSITSNEIFDLNAFPSRLLVLGGGYIATEFAGIFNGLGSQVTHDDIRRFAADEIRKTGVDLRFNANIVQLQQAADGLVATLTDGSSITVDTVLCATGRHPNIDSLNLGCTQVSLSAQGTIEINSNYQTKEPSIFALGDMTGGPQLTPVAIAEAMAFAHEQFSDTPKPVDYNMIPTAVFSQPNIGTVGLTETEAKAQGLSLQIFKSEFRPMKHTLSGRDERTLMKLIVDYETDRVVGLHMVGPDAGEICQGMAVAMKAGATKQHFDDTIGIHPTAAEEFVTMRTPES
jgi:glutathione reductase (NADPH)